MAASRAGGGTVGPRGGGAAAEVVGLVGAAAGTEHLRRARHQLPTFAGDEQAADTRVPWLPSCAACRWCAASASPPPGGRRGGRSTARSAVRRPLVCTEWSRRKKGFDGQHAPPESGATFIKMTKIPRVVGVGRPRESALSSYASGGGAPSCLCHPWMQSSFLVEGRHSGMGPPPLGGCGIPPYGQRSRSWDFVPTIFCFFNCFTCTPKKKQRRQLAGGNHAPRVVSQRSHVRLWRPHPDQ